jgi:hypothetical protein
MNNAGEADPRVNPFTVLEIFIMSTIHRVQFGDVPGSSSSLKNNAPTGASFKEVLSAKDSSSSLASAIRSGLERLDGSWKASFQKSEKIVSALPKEYKPLFEAQVSVSRMHFQTEMITKIGDSVQGTMKKLQQQGS